MKPLRPALFVLLLAGGGFSLWRWLPASRQPSPWLGYAEADYVKLAPTQPGRLVSIAVARGDTVAAGAALFAQDDAEDRAARDEAGARLAEAEAKLADLRAAGREAEILQARAELAEMQAAYDRVARDLTRNESIVASGATTRQSVDQLRADSRSAQARVQAAEAKLTLVSAPTGRERAIAAQEATVAAARAALESAQWRLDQRRVAAPAAGLIADTFARPGETLAAGSPVVSLLSPENIFVRFFVPEAELARLHAGARVGVACDSCPAGLTAAVAFVATAPEYTPPVIYSDAARGSLVYLIEARPDPARRPWLKPGQPVDVTPLAGSAP